jgi:putative spermidine/putrescine transport system permease protein
MRLSEATLVLPAARSALPERVRTGLVRAGLLAPALSLLLPLLVACGLLVRYSFNGWDPTRTMYAAWTLDNYRAVLGDPFYRGVLWNTLQIGAIVTGAALALAYPVAYAIAAARRRQALVVLVVVPLWMDVLIRAYGWIVLLSRGGLVNTLLLRLQVVEAPVRFLATPLAVVLELLHEVLPFMILTLASILQRIDPALREAAMNLGAGPLAAFWRVTLPLSLPGVLASTMLTFSLAISAFAGPLILGGGRVPVMSLIINQQMTYGLNWPLGSAEAVTLMALVLTLLYLYSLVVRRLPAAT